MRVLAWHREEAISIGDPGSCAPYGSIFLNPYAPKIMQEFRWRDYRRLNPDLVLDTEQQAREHFVFRGYNEKRLMDAERLHRFDPEFYRKNHRDLIFKSDREARVHYSYAGYYERRIANTVDEWVSSATLHIFQPGKVGSHAISTAIDGKYPGGALHLHWPTDLSLYFPWCTLTYPAVVNRPRLRRLRVVSAGRDVVSYVISGAFQYLSTVGSEGNGYVDAKSVHAYLASSFEANCQVLEKWFDHQFYCGMDIYSYAFDHERGFIQISNDVIDLFLYRVESLPKIEAELGRFLELEDFRLLRSNAASSKAYWKDYQEIFRTYVIPSDLLERLYSSRYMRYFFSEDERTRKMEYWSKFRTS